MEELQFSLCVFIAPVLSCLVFCSVIAKLPSVSFSLSVVDSPDWPSDPLCLGTASCVSEKESWKKETDPMVSMPERTELEDEGKNPEDRAKSRQLDNLSTAVPWAG